MQKKMGSAFIIVFAALMFTGGQCRAESLLARANGYFEDGRYLEALTFYRDMVNNNRSQAETAAALFGLGRLFDIYLGDWERALSCYDRHIALQGAHIPQALHFSARLMGRFGMQDLARKRYRRILSDYASYSGAAAVRQELDALMQNRLPPDPFSLGEPEDLPAMVRVLIAEEAGPLTVSCKTLIDCSADDNGTDRLCTVEEAVLRAEGSSLQLNGSACNAPVLRLRGRGDEHLRVNGREYRCAVTVSAHAGRVVVINHLPLDEYLYGVLPREIHSSWPDAALQAQAVAARTYALYHMILRRGERYDVLATTSSQVYSGVGGERSATNRAVDATRAQVLAYQGRLVLTLYHSNSGGMVEPMGDVWESPLPYLRRVADAGSTQGRGAEWSCTVTGEKISERLQEFGFERADVEAIAVGRRSTGGRVMQLKLTGKGWALVLSGNSFRMIAGPGVIKSTCFTVQREKGLFRFSGKGYGHGVGMSQWGAYALAKQGIDYTAILSHYYPGTYLYDHRPKSAVAAPVRPASAF